LPGEKVENAKIAVNTEWSINGTAPPMRDLGLINAWDDKLSAQNEKPGFQPLEYMTAGRYLGELGRIILLDYLIGTLKVSRNSLPSEMLQQDSLTTTFLSHFKPLDAATLLPMLRKELSESPESGFAWTEHHAEALYHIAKAIEVRAAGIIAAAILALLTIGGELPAEEEEDASMASPDMRELGVGYTGGCVVHFQDYLSDCQAFIDGLVRRRSGAGTQLSVVMSPCHDGGITGAGILVAAALSSQRSRT
jgi:hexokinase